MLVPILVALLLDLPERNFLNLVLNIIGAVVSFLLLLLTAIASLKMIYKVRPCVISI